MKNVRVRRGDQDFFCHLDLTLPADCSSVVLGPNGSGKSTLLQLISRDLYPMPDADSRCLILGQESWNLVELRQRMGFVSHELQNRFLKDAPALHVVVSGYYGSISTRAHQLYDGRQISQAVDLMDWFGVAHLRERRFDSLSTGQQRRLLLARALINKPEYLILDEPTSALDISASQKLLTLLEDLIAQGTKMVLVTHHVEEILPGIRWAALLKSGASVSSGAKAEVLTSHAMANLFEIPLELHEESGWYRLQSVNSSV